MARPFAAHRNLFLFLALALYGLFSSPTPEDLGLAEIAIGLLLAAAIGVESIFAVFSGRLMFTSLRVPAISFAILFFIPLLTGVLGHHHMRDVMRDIIPLGYLFLPLFLAQRADEDTQKALLWGLTAVGVFYALRFWPSSHLTFTRLGLDRGDDEMLYLTSSPAVSFAGLYLFFAATSEKEKPFWTRAAMLFLSATCLLTIVAILQRGALLLIIAALWFYALGRIKRSLHFGMFAFAITIIMAFAFGGLFADTLATIWRKTLLVGDNARFAELNTVREALNRNPVQWLTGAGWGAVVTTAASGHAEVRYTHMLIGYVLLKGGLLGLAALVAYLAVLLRAFSRRMSSDSWVCVAAMPPIFLGLTLYPSFKMLCFGAMLALIAPLRQVQDQDDRQRPTSFYQPRLSAR